MMIKNVVNDIKIGFKVIGCFGLLFIVVAVMMLCARQYVSDQDSMYRQYIGAIRETGELKASIDKIEGYLYYYVTVPSARNNTLASINQEKNSIDQIVQTYKGKELAPEEKKFLSDFDAAWPEVQRGYKEIMKLADDGKKDEVARLLADGSYLIEARKNTLAAVHNLNDYNASRNEAAIKEELIYRVVFDTRDAGRHAIFNYIEVFYNRLRLHSAIGCILENYTNIL